MLRPASVLCLALALAAGETSLGPALDARTLAIADGSPVVSPWFWRPEQRQAAGRYSQQSVVEDGGVRCLRLAIAADMPWLRTAYDVPATIGPDHLDPRCDAVRLRYRVAEGSFRIGLGGPTAYFACSDVFTEPLELTPSPRWQEATLALDGALRRNLRRAGFGAAMPAIAYARWIQEGMRLSILAGSQGVLLLERIELLAQGRGQPYPEPPAEGMAAAGPALAPTAADLFTVFIQRDLDLSKPARMPQAAWRPAAASLRTGAGGPVWEVRMRGAEEVSFAGCRLRLPAEAHGLALTVAAGAMPRPPQVVDLLVLAAEGEVPWPSLAPPAPWRQDPATAFDAFLTARTTATAALALYHVRRAVPPAGSARLLIPWDDAVCIWGSGTCAAWCTANRPLAAGQIRAVLVAPPFRHHASESVLSLSGLQPVTLPPVPGGRRSFAHPAAGAMVLGREESRGETWLVQRPAASTPP